MSVRADIRRPFLDVSRRIVPGLVAAALIAGCSTSPVSGSDGEPPAESAPWPQRPVVELAFDVTQGLKSVTGREKLVFTPDLRVCELVFRAWPNKPTTARTGSSLAVTTAAVDGRIVTPRVSAAGAPEDAPGTLIEIPLPQCVEAGASVTAELDFRMELGEHADERVGHSPSAETAWFATAFPLLAWERERGWAREPAVRISGETASSEDFRLASLEVTAPSQYSVLGTGTAAGTRPGGGPGATVHRFTADAVRDVAVSVGRMTVLENEVDGVRVHIAGPQRETDVALEDWMQNVGDSMRRLSELLGPFPYPDLWITIVPDQTEGVEFPGAIQFGDVGRREQSWLVSHELAHMWFYALVGNNQGRDPWLDEGFATFAQAVVDDHEDNYDVDHFSEDRPGSLGGSMTYWADRGGSRRYVRGVYDQGAAVLLEARRRAGADRFDTALRSYVHVNAHRIATASDVAAAFEDLPEVIDLLQQVGALE
jgi:hypothetical protein